MTCYYLGGCQFIAYTRKPCAPGICQGRERDDMLTDYLREEYARRNDQAEIYNGDNPERAEVSDRLQMQAQREQGISPDSQPVRMQLPSPIRDVESEISDRISIEEVR